MVSVECDDVHHAAVHEAAGRGEAPDASDDVNDKEIDHDCDNDSDNYSDIDGDGYLMIPREAPDCCTWALIRYRPSEEHRDCGENRKLTIKL